MILIFKIIINKNLTIISAFFMKTKEKIHEFVNAILVIFFDIN